MGFGDAGDHALGHFPAFFRFTEAAGDEHDAVRGVVFNDFIHQRRNLFRSDGDDEQIQRIRKRTEVRHAAHPAGVVFAVTDDDEFVAVKTGVDDVFKDDPPEIPALGGNADDADGFRVQQVGDFLDGTGSGAFAGSRKAAHAVQRDHEVVRERERVDLQFFNDERCIGVAGGEIVPHADERLEAFDKLVVGHNAALPAGQPGQFPVGDGLAEKLEEGIAVGQFRQCGDDGLPFAETLGVELGVRTAEARADDHAELACAAQPDDQLVAERCGVRRHELYLQDALEVCGDGVLERGSRQSLVAFGRGGGAAFDPFGIAFRHLGEHTPHGGTHFVGRFGDDAHAAHFGLVDDGGGDDFQHGLFAGQGHDLLFHRFGVPWDEGAFARRFRTGKAQQIVHFEFIEKMPPLSVGVAEQLGNGLIFNSQIHASLQLVVRSERESSLPNRFYPFSPGEGIRL